METCRILVRFTPVPAQTFSEGAEAHFLSCGLTVEFMQQYCSVQPWGSEAVSRNFDNSMEDSEVIKQEANQSTSAWNSEGSIHEI